MDFPHREAYRNISRAHTSFSQERHDCSTRFSSILQKCLLLYRKKIILWIKPQSRLSMRRILHLKNQSSRSIIIEFGWFVPHLIIYNLPAVANLTDEWLAKLPGASDTAASFEFEEEDHTLGNALRYMIMKKSVEPCPPTKKGKCNPPNLRLQS